MDQLTINIHSQSTETETDDGQLAHDTTVDVVSVHHRDEGVSHLVGFYVQVERPMWDNNGVYYLDASSSALCHSNQEATRVYTTVCNNLGVVRHQLPWE